VLKIEENIIAKRWDERMATLPKEKVELIESPIGKEQLIKLSRSKEVVKEGDVFVLSLAEGMYFYGKVIEANIQHTKGDTWMTGCHVVFIFKSKSKTKDMHGYKADYKDLLVGSKIVSIDYWKRGLFETIGNISLTAEEKKLDYGFFDMEFLGRWGAYYKANGEELNHEPAFLGNYGISTLTGIYSAIRTEFIINPDLLKF
jgi:hypothetical protein